MSKLIHIDEVKHNPNTVLTVGTFDGVHAGHKALMETVIEKAKARDARSVVVTFDPHPREIINPGANGIRLLTTIEERAEILNQMGIDEIVIIPFTRDFSLLSSEEFVVDIIHKKIGVSEFVIGYDHQFGKDREGSIETVERVGKELGFDSYVVSKREMGDITISSSAIRRAVVNEGDVKMATEMLGRPLCMHGLVTHGDERGRTIGYPTANLNPDHPKKIVPKNGVYAVWVKVDDMIHKGMMNIGIRPTFEGVEPQIEVHILDFNMMIYGKTIQIQYIERIRDEKKFSGVDELVAQLDSDKQTTEKLLSNAKAAFI